MANSFSRAFIKPVKKRIKPFTMANKASCNLMGKNPLSYFEFMKKFYSLYTKYGFMPDEVQRLGLLNLKDNPEECFISKKKMVAQQYILNPKPFMELTEDKAVFSIYCEKNNIPIPKLFGLFFKDSCGINWIGGEPLSKREEWIDFFVNHCPDEFVIKPSRGVYGEGIIFVDKKKDDFSGESIHQQLKKSRFDSFVIQEALKNHTSILAVSPKEGLQTLRVITFIDEYSEVKVICAYLKIIVGNNMVDNHKGGKLGNLLCEINLFDGSLNVPFLITEGGLIQKPKHPDTGKHIAGIKLPFWKDVTQLAKEIAPHFLPMRAIGWDIALTPNGPCIIEGNARWDPPKFGNFGEKQLLSFGKMSILQEF